MTKSSVDQGYPGISSMAFKSAIFVGIMLFLACLRAKQRRAFLGHVWLVAPAIATALAFSLLREWRVFSVGSTELPYLVFVLSGVLLWQCFFDALSEPMNQLRSQSEFLAFSPVRFEPVIFASIATVVTNSSIRLFVLIAVLLLWGVSPTLDWVFVLVPAVIFLLLVGAVTSLMLAPLAQLSDDVVAAIGLLGSFGIFLVPAIYPIPDGNWLALNPLVPIFDFARAGMIGGNPDWSNLWGLLALPALFFIAWRFNVASRPHIAARLI